MEDVITALQELQSSRQLIIAGIKITNGSIKKMKAIKEKMEANKEELEALMCLGPQQ